MSYSLNCIELMKRQDRKDTGYPSFPIDAAEGRDLVMHSRIGVLRALRHRKATEMTRHGI